MSNREVKLISVLDLRPGMLVRLQQDKLILSVVLDPFQEQYKMYIAVKDEFLLVVEVESGVFYPNSWEYRQEGPFHTVKFLTPDGKFAYDTSYIGNSNERDGHVDICMFEYCG